MIFAEAYALLSELHKITDAAQSPGADIAGLAQRLEPIAVRLTQADAASDCALLWWPSSYAGYFDAGLESSSTLASLLAASPGPIAWVCEEAKLAELTEQGRAFVQDAMLALSRAGRVIIVKPEQAGLAGGLCAGVVTANPQLAQAFRTWGRHALSDVRDLPNFIASLNPPDLGAELATALQSAAQLLEASFRRETLGVG